MIKDLQEFHHDATQILRPNMETWGKRSCVKSQYIKDTGDVVTSHVDPAKRIRELPCNKDEAEERAQAAEPEIACLNGDYERAMYLTQAEYEEERVQLAAEVESLRAIVAESGVFRSANEELRARVLQLEEDARNNTLALDAQEKMKEKLRTTEVLLTQAREAADSNNKMANKYEHGWSRVSAASTLVADAILGDTRISGDKELDRLNKAHVEAEALMATARATCTALFPDTDIGRNAASVANVMIDGPSEFHKWKVSASREGARMALATVVSHYPTLKLGKVQEGVNPDEPDVQALGRKVEHAAWKLASYCPLENHMDDLPAQEQE
ncbi:uncharacterized protein LOC119346905 [Triticum dicoccoides]|uniref:uncharacterized protein LOC119346905 n=2 Tax=Triticum dicoccoides TaxID=85692 RepID=UPI00188E785D|nr:uncharacterized protein LOC119343678 isoform X2 [Triticum dicoccoides]XP_037471896.1 uncharacterized protein LOC119346905 [Triticum dicoccoides]